MIDYVCLFCYFSSWYQVQKTEQGGIHDLHSFCLDGQIRFVGKIQMLELAFCDGISFARR